MDTTEINVNKKSVKELLKTGSISKFVIPDYQRPYNWSEDEITTLFDDLWEATLDAINNPESNKTFLLGSIVTFYNPEKNEQEIKDIEMAHFIMLSLYREYSKCLLKYPQQKNEYITKMRQIKQDLRHLTRQELINKAQTLYLKTLKNMENINEL